MRDKDLSHTADLLFIQLQLFSATIKHVLNTEGSDSLGYLRLRAARDAVSDIWDERMRINREKRSEAE